MSSLRTKLVTAAAVGAAAIGGATVANAATSGSSRTGSTAASTTAKGPHTVNGKSETPLTGTTAAKVKAAGLAKVPGTVDRLETNVDGNAPYEAHIVRTSDGAEVEVQVNADFTVAAVNAVGGHGDHDHDGPGQP